MTISLSERPPGSTIKLSWNPPGGLLTLSFTNALLRILTLGIYGFWAKTEVRKRIWSGIRLENEPLQYTGTGMELFKGFLVVFFLLLVPTLVVLTSIIIAFGPQSLPTALAQVSFYILFLFLVFFGAYRATRYRLSRTLWRGIRGGLDGSAGSYAASSMWRLLANILTLGWLTPVNSVALQGMITKNMRFGSEPFRFTATTGRLYGPFALLWLGIMGTIALVAFLGAMLLIPPGMFEPGYVPQPPRPEQIAMLVGLYVLALILFTLMSAWYGAIQLRHFAAHTHFNGATFESRVTAPGFIWLGLSNFLLVLFSLGILMPIAQARTARYLVENLSINGTVNLNEILQGAEARTGSGEGLAQAFELDAFA
jgi:uncharacterized membrane protein YjgN (DUF898 family)